MKKPIIEVTSREDRVARGKKRKNHLAPVEYFKFCAMHIGDLYMSK